MINLNLCCIHTDFSFVSLWLAAIDSNGRSINYSWRMVIIFKHGNYVIILQLDIYVCLNRKFNISGRAVLQSNYGIIYFLFIHSTTNNFGGGNHLLLGSKLIALQNWKQ